MAMNNGLSAGIVNPSSEPMMSAYYSFNALIGEDDQCMEYIANASQAADKPANTTTAKSTELSLDEAIIKGLAESAHVATVKLLNENVDSLTIINEKLIPALDVVGKGFEEKKMFLPQLLMSADAAKASFEAIKEVLSKQGKNSESKGKIVIATVKGDIHDIGKNIVKTLLENYGFDMIDLGKDVAPELILKTVQENNVKLVGLSALMTTTVVNMEATIKLLRENNVDCKVMVGGAVLTQEYADMIGADFYSKDAMGSVRYANELHDMGEL
jgi:5-methyltetrahydrofolate--homocysteine methyltransferase